MKKVSQSIFAVMLLLCLITLSVPALAQLPPPTDNVKDAFPAQKHYSPYAGRNFPTKVFWGDTHLHTGNSMDAGAFGARLLPDDAHRFARGEELTSSTGLQVKLSRPLDFLVVADHSDNMGFFPLLHSGDPKMLADPTGKKWYDMIQAGGAQGVAAAVEHRGSGEIQRAWSLHSVHRLRVDLDREGREPTPRRHLPRWGGQGEHR
jgi:hypothetical protein